jgi:plastocyanin
MSHPSLRAAPAVAWLRRVPACVAVPLVLIAFALLAFAHLCSAAESQSMPLVTAGKTVEITISNFTFAPPEITISPGTTVKWINQDDIPHLVAEKNLAFKSQALDTNDSFSFTFSAPGEVEYYCVLHPHMTGKIIVKAGAASATDESSVPYGHSSH